MHIASPLLRVLAASLAGALFAACADEPYDLLISGGLLVDGSGAPAVREDLAVRGDRIAARGRLGGARAHRVVDAHGMVVAPGFIDVLGHSGVNLLVEPGAESKIRQGITSEITGEGRSPAPQDERTRGELEAFAKRHALDVGWSDFDAYFARLEERGIALNLGSYVGATQLRKLVVGWADRPPSAAELVRMQRHVREAMEQGAVGLSSALVYQPASYARTDELVALAQVAADHGGIYATHLRGEGDRIFEALEEAFEVARQTGTRVEIFHLKAAGPGMRGRMDEVLARVEAARAGGIDVAADVYPYAGAQTSLAATLPPWAHAGGSQGLLQRLRDPEARARLRRELVGPAGNWENFYRMAGGAGGILLSDIGDPNVARYQGMRMDALARLWEREPIDALFDLLLADHASTRAIFFLASNEDMELALARPWVSIATDAPAVRAGGSVRDAKPHPRAYGTFPRVLRRYVVEKQLLSLEEAIRKMTSLPAERLGLRDRGRLSEGFFADVVVFNPESVRDVATYDDPARYSTGIEYVLVNGELVLDAGEITGALPGRALRGPGWRPIGERTPARLARREPTCDASAIPSASAPLVVVAHPEDASLGFAGPIFEATRAGHSAHVVILTDGQTACAACRLWKHGAPGADADACTARELSIFGRVRRREALDALALLGVDRGGVTFLGHVAGTLRPSWTDPSRAPALPACVPEGPLPEQWQEKTGAALRRDLEELLRRQPGSGPVFTTHPYDGDADHGAAYQFLRAALQSADPGREIYLAVLRNNADDACAYPNPAARRCAPPSHRELESAPALLSQRREERYRPLTWWQPPADVDYETPLHSCLASELYEEPQALKRRAIEAHETQIGVRDRRGATLPSEYRGWADPSGRLLGFVHRNEILYRDPGSFPSGR